MSHIFTSGAGMSFDYHDRNQDEGALEEAEAQLHKVYAAKDRQKDLQALIEGKHEAMMDEDHNEHLKKMKDQQKEDKKAEKSVISRLVAGDQDAQDAKSNLLRDSLMAMPDAVEEHLSQQKAEKFEEKMQKQIDETLYGKTKPGDQVSLSKMARAAMIAQQKEQEAKQKQQKEDNAVMDLDAVAEEAATVSENDGETLWSKRASEKQQAAKQLSKHFVGVLFSGSDKHKRELKKHREDLLKSNTFTRKELAGIENLVGQAVKSHVTYDIKKHLLRLFFNKSSRGSAIALKDKSAMMKQLEKAAKLEGHSANIDIKQMFAQVQGEIQRDMPGFVFDEAVSALVQHQVGDMDLEGFEAHLKATIMAAENAGATINQRELMEKVQRGIEDLGLAAFDPSMVPGMAGSSSSMDSNGDGDDEPAIEYINPQEQLEDKLRNVYMQQALNPSMRDKVGIKLEIVKLKNGLIKLGVNVTDGLKEEGEFLAQMRLFEQLSDNYRKQSTFHQLDGADYDIVKQERSLLIRNLRRLGVKVKRSDLERIRDDMNLEMAPVLYDKIKQMELATQLNSRPALSQQYKVLMETMDRLKLETPILNQSALFTDLSSHLDGEIAQAIA